MAPKNQISFTQTRVAALSQPQAGRTYWYDSKTPGLCVCVTAAGARSFYLYKKIGGRKGRPVRVLLGKFPSMSVDDARNTARDTSNAYAKGRDPQAERQARRHEHTVGGLWGYWLDAHASPHKKESSRKEDQRQYDAFLKPWAGRKLSAIKKSDVQALHARIGRKNGHYAANRVLALLRAMFNKAGDMGYLGPNPAVGIQRFKEVARDRFLTGDELPAFFAALNAEPNAMLRDFFMFALLTGARRANVQAMRWEELDLERGLWRIPDTKAGVPMVVPLVAPAVELLRARREASNGSEYVFPSRGKTGHIVEPKAAWKRILDQAGLQDVRIHDLRRTLGSWQALGGSSLQVIGKSLGHSQITTTAIYARLTVDPVRASVDKATAAIIAAGEKKNGKSEPQVVEVAAEVIGEANDE